MFSLLAQTFSPGDTSTFLLILAVGTAAPILVGLLIVKPVPLTPTSPNSRDRSATNGYSPIQGEDTGVFTGELQEVTPASEGDTEADADSAPLLLHEQGGSELCPVPNSPSAIELRPQTGVHDEMDIGDKGKLPDIHGKQLWLSPDFYLVFVIMAICEWLAQMS